MQRDPALLLWGAAYAYAASSGAVLGAVLGPAIAWGLLRRVPLGAAVSGVALGSLGGALLGLGVQAAVPGFGYSWLWGALAGVSLAALRLRWRYSRAAFPRAVVAPPNEALQLSGMRGEGSAAAGVVVSDAPRALTTRS